MSQSAILRAAGAYADEVARHLGLLTLKASVLAGLRIQDGNKYAPDERLIPKDPGRLLDQLRDAWLEYDSLGKDLGAYLEDRDQIAINLSQMAQTHSWTNALPLAAVAAELRRWDPLAQVTLAANFLRVNSLQKAGFTVASVQRRGDLPASIQSRLYRNMACIVELKGDPELATHLAVRAANSDPTNALSREDSLAYGLHYFR
ncbi:MAG: hypothetical protein H8E31_03510 [Planctomycetes bacterium]|nr:hypothetical protein [Planctomycetota bacterium]